MSFQDISVGASSPLERRAGTATPAQDPSMQMLDGHEQYDRTEQLSAAPEAARNGGMDLTGERAAVNERVWMPMGTEHGETVPVHSRRQHVATNLVEERLLTLKHRVKQDPPVIEVDEHKFGTCGTQFTQYAQRIGYDMHDKRIMHCFLGDLGEEYDGVARRAGDSTEAPMSKSNIMSLLRERYIDRHRATSPAKSRPAKTPKSPSKTKSRRCRKEGHDLNSCPEISCYRCNQQGHIARNCPQR